MVKYQLPTGTAIRGHLVGTSRFSWASRGRLVGVSTITITIKILLLQLDASHETARRHPSSPRRKLIICPTPIVANKLPCDRSWQGATAPAARHKTQETQPLSVPLTNRLDLRTLGTNGPTRTPHSLFLPPGSLPPRRLARRYAPFLLRRPHRTRPTLPPSYRTTLPDRAHGSPQGRPGA